MIFVAAQRVISRAIALGRYELRKRSSRFLRADPVNTWGDADSQSDTAPNVRHRFVMLLWDEHCMVNANSRLLARWAAAPGVGLALRVFAVAGLGGVSGGLFYAHADALVGAVPLWLFAGGVYASLIGASATLIFAFLPKFSQFVELTAISRLVVAFVSLLEPKAAATLTASPLLNATLVVGGALSLRYLLRARLHLQDSVWSSVPALGSPRAH